MSKEHNELGNKKLSETTKNLTRQIRQILEDTQRAYEKIFIQGKKDGFKPDESLALILPIIDRPIDSDNECNRDVLEYIRNEMRDYVYDLCEEMKRNE